MYKNIEVLLTNIILFFSFNLHLTFIRTPLYIAVKRSIRSDIPYFKLSSFRFVIY